MGAWGAGLPGGDGFKIKYANPIYLDDVAADFPGLTIIGAHPSWPWQDEMLAIAMHKPNVYMDLSGWSPRYFPPVLVQYLKGPLKHKFIFGTDYPFIKPGRWLRDFDQLKLRRRSRRWFWRRRPGRLSKSNKGPARFKNNPTGEGRA